MKYIWKLKYDKQSNEKDILRKILEVKNINKSEVKTFINCNLPVHSPFLLRNMEEAVTRIQKYKKILIFSDFDADGINATYVMYRGLMSLQNKFHWDIGYIIPERSDGYGLRKESIDNIKNLNYEVIITVDNGITALDAIEYAQSLGIDVIVTDHHKPGVRLPNCLIIDPQVDDYPFKYLCGAMVAFKFIQALYEKLNMKLDEELYKELLSSATIATVADVMDLSDENRTLVSEGLNYITHTNMIGLKKLMEILKINEMHAQTISFQIGPIMNAAGRVASPKVAFNLLMADDEVTAGKLANELVNLNKERRQVQKEIVETISEDLLKDDFIILHIPNDMKVGLLGPIASAISERYMKPCFVLSGKDKLSGSGRAANGYSILSFINTSRDILEGGGHESAAGISVLEKDLEELRERSNKHYRAWLKENNKSDKAYIYCLCEVDIKTCTMRLARDLAMLEPYGKGNQQINFVANDLKVRSVKILGDNAAIKFTLEQNGYEIKAIGFSKILSIYKEDMNVIDAVFNIEINTWNGISEVQLTLIDIRRNEF